MVIIKKYKVKKTFFNKFPEISGKIGINFRKFSGGNFRKFPNSQPYYHRCPATRRHTFTPAKGSVRVLWAAIVTSNGACQPNSFAVFLVKICTVQHHISANVFGIKCAIDKGLQNFDTTTTHSKSGELWSSSCCNYVYPFHLPSAIFTILRHQLMYLDSPDGACVYRHLPAVFTVTAPCNVRFVGSVAIWLQLPIRQQFTFKHCNFVSVQQGH